MSPTDGEAVRRRVLTAGIVFFAAAAAVALTARDSGLTWDEPIYLKSALDYMGWFRSFSAGSFGEEAILRTWWQPDHPPLAKLWIAFSIMLFGGPGHLIGAARVGAGILFGAVAAAIYLWAASRRGDRAGLFAAAAFALMPRLFAHGHFANIEMPLLLLTVLTTVAFERGIRRPGWSVACGALFGLALLTKINGAFLPLVLLPWGFLFHGRRALRNAVCMAVLGPVVFLAGWPVMWHHPIQATTAYLANKLNRAAVSTYYLGTVYSRPHAPWHYPFVYLLAATPLPVLACVTAGIRQAVRRLRAEWRKADHEVLALWSFAFPVLLLALPGIPKYDGVRLMLTAYPFLALLAAYGAEGIWSWVHTHVGHPRRAAYGLGVVLAVWLLLPFGLFHPFELDYYGELAGGPWGAERLGFETTYWHETFNRDALAYLNAHVPTGGRVALVGVQYRVWQLHQVLGEVREDIRHAEFEGGSWDFLVVVMRQSLLADEVREFMAVHQPAWTRTLSPLGGPPVCLIYARPALTTPLSGSPEAPPTQSRSSASEAR